MVSRRSERALEVDHLQADLAGRSVRGGMVTIGALAIRIAMQFATIIVLSQLLPPQAFGLMAMVAAVTEILECVKDFGLSAATIQKKDITHEQVTALFWLNTCFGSAVALILFATAPLLAQFYNHAELAEIAPWLALAFILSGMTTQHLALLGRQMRFNTMAAMGLGAELLAMAVAVAAALMGAGYWALVAQRLTYCLAMLAAAWLAAGWWPSLPGRCAGLWSLLAFGSSVAGSNMINAVGRSVDQVMIGWYWGALPLGLYERSYKLLMSPVNTSTAPIYSVGMPALSRLHDSPERYRQAYISLSEKLAMVTVPAAALVILTADSIVAVLLGPQWAEAAPILAWLGLAAALSPAGITTGLLFVTQARGGDLLKVGAIGSAIGVVAIVVGLPFGPTGVAASLALATLFLRVPLCFWLAGRSGPVTIADLYASVFPSVITGSAVLALGLAFRSHFLFGVMPFATLACSAALAVAVSVICFGCIPRSRRAMQSIRSLSSKMFHPERAAA